MVSDLPDTPNVAFVKSFFSLHKFLSQTACYNPMIFFSPILSLYFFFFLPLLIFYNHVYVGGAWTEVIRDFYS